MIKILVLFAVPCWLLTASLADAQQITVTRAGSQPSRSGPAEYFTGPVRIDPLFASEELPHLSAASVTFEAGAHSAWHTHPAGQILVATSGIGRVQRWGDALAEIRAGDVVWIPANQEHWHGAAPGSRITHIAIQAAVGGKNVEWMEKLTVEQYKIGVE